MAIISLTQTLASSSISLATAATTAIATTTALVAATASSTAQASAIPSSSPMDDDDSGECQLLGPFSIVIQGALGALALLSLVYKRWRERPQRPLKIWAFDVSKQVFGSLLLHLVNLLMSLVSSGSLAVKPGEYQANPCSFYLLNLAIDTTIGIPILIILLRIFTVAASKTPLGQPPESIRSGNYGDPAKVKWWLKQVLIYFMGLLGMKFCVFFFFKICPWIVKVGDWALGWTEGNEALQIFFVMLLFPVIMNAIQYYIIDSFIKNKEEAGHEPVPTEDYDEDHGDADDGGDAREISLDGVEEDEDLKSGVEIHEETPPSSGSSVTVKVDPATPKDDEESGSTHGSD